MPRSTVPRLCHSEFGAALLRSLHWSFRGNAWLVSQTRTGMVSVTNQNSKGEETSLHQPHRIQLTHRGPRDLMWYILRLILTLQEPSVPSTLRGGFGVELPAEFARFACTRDFAVHCMYGDLPRLGHYDVSATHYWSKFTPHIHSIITNPLSCEY